MFIFSYNDESRINPILRDRMYRIVTKGYEKKEKKIIARDFLLPKIRQQVAFNEEDITIPDETLELLKVQRDMSIKQLIQFPDLYYSKSHFPLEISQCAFDHLWRMCESYELWCKETKQKELIFLNIIE